MSSISRLRDRARFPRRRWRALAFGSSATTLAAVAAISFPGGATALVSDRPDTGSLTIVQEVVPPGRVGEDVSGSVPAGEGRRFHADTTVTGVGGLPGSRTTTGDGTGAVRFGLAYPQGTDTAPITVTGAPAAGYDMVTPGGANALCADLSAGKRLHVTNAGSVPESSGFTVEVPVGASVVCRVYQRREVADVHDAQPDTFASPESSGSSGSPEVQESPEAVGPSEAPEASASLGSSGSPGRPEVSESPGMSDSTGSSVMQGAEEPAEAPGAPGAQEASESAEVPEPDEPSEPVEESGAAGAPEVSVLPSPSDPGPQADPLPSGESIGEAPAPSGPSPRPPSEPQSSSGPMPPADPGDRRDEPGDRRGAPEPDHGGLGAPDSGRDDHHSRRPLALTGPSVGFAISGALLLTGLGLAAVLVARERRQARSPRADS